MCSLVCAAGVAQKLPPDSLFFLVYVSCPSSPSHKAGENVSTTSRPAQEGVGGASSSSSASTPQASFDITEDTDTLQVCVKLSNMDLSSLKISDVNLDVGRRVISLVLPGGVKQALPLPAAIDPDTAKAAFKKKAGKIQLTLNKA